MKIKAILKPKSQLQIIHADDTIKQALDLIADNRMFSLPVMDGDEFLGALSKRYVYEQFFEEESYDKEAFLSRHVREFMITKMPVAKENASIETAALMFIESKFRFIPVVNELGAFVGIVTQQAVFKEYQKLFGSGLNSMTICFYDYQGSLARIAKIISKEGGNIKNTVIMNTDTMGLQELFVRVDCKDFAKLKHTLAEEGYDVRS